MSTSLSLRVEWLDAPDVTTPELAATWARYEIWCDDECITQAESSDSTFRRGVYGALYPFAEWVVDNWWLLIADVRPSSVGSHYWGWRNLSRHEWLRHHNLRAAGNGMAWPNLTVVPEGAVTRVRWFADRVRRPGSVRFVSSGKRFVQPEDIEQGLSEVVTVVLDRLTDARLPKTRLAAEWHALGELTADERQFCAAAARLGLDPFSVPDGVADQMVRAADLLPSELIDSFFDSVNLDSLTNAATWTQAAQRKAQATSSQAQVSLRILRDAVSEHPDIADRHLPWEFGYAMAARVREALADDPVDPFDISPWVPVAAVDGDPGGIQGLLAVFADRCGLVMGDPNVGKSTRAFAQARALGRALGRPNGGAFLLSATRGSDEQIARAFAAELLAPAGGIRKLLDEIGSDDDPALDAVADRFGVSPLVVRHQYDNQIAKD